jgi:hypothetical protein
MTWPLPSNGLSEVAWSKTGGFVMFLPIGSAVADALLL